MGLPVPIVVLNSQPMVTVSGNTALTLAISRCDMAVEVLVMNSTYRNNIEAYLSAMIQVKRVQAIGILTPTDYSKIDTIMAGKYGISSCSIYRSNSLINSHFSGNMSHYKEVDYV